MELKNKTIAFLKQKYPDIIFFPLAKEQKVPIKLSLIDKDTVELRFKNSSDYGKEWKTLTGYIMPNEYENYGIKCGKESGIFILDIDNKTGNKNINGLDAWKETLKVNNDNNEIDTTIVNTPSGGFHYYFKYDSRLDGINNRTKCCKLNGTSIDWDLLADAYAVGPGSKLVIDNKKKSYKYVKNHSFNSCKINLCPEWLMNMLLKKDLTSYDSKNNIVDKQDNISVDSEPKVLIECVKSILSEYKLKPIKKEIKTNLPVTAVVDTTKKLNLYVNNKKIKKSINEMDKNELIIFKNKQQKKKNNAVIGLEKLKTLLDALEYKHFENNYTRWFKLLCICHNSVRDEEKDNARNIFINFCEQMHNFDKLEIEKCWEKVKAEEYFSTYNKILKFILIDNLCKKKYMNANTELNKFYCNLLPTGNDKIYYLKRFIVYIIKDKKFAIIKYNNNKSKNYEEVIDIDLYLTKDLKDRLSNLSKVEMTEKKGDKVKCTVIDTFKYFVEYCKDRKDYEDFTYDINDYKKHQEDYLLINVIIDYKQTETDKTKIGNKCKFIVDHIKNIICSGKEEEFNYMMHWLAHVVTEPQKKTEVALYLLSKSGTGKSLIFDDLLSENIIGRAYSSKIDSVDSIADFQTSVINKTCVVFDEVEKTIQSKSIESKIKTLITQRSHFANEKYKLQKTLYSFCNLIFMSNKTESTLEMDEDDRRFFILYISDAKKGDYDYFKILHDDVYDKEKIQDFVNLLYTYNVKDFNFRKIPQNNFAKEVKCQNPVDLFVKSLSDALLQDSTVLLKPAIMYESYKEYCSKFGYKYINYNTFNKLIYKNNYVSLKHTKHGNFLELIGSQVQEDSKKIVKLLNESDRNINTFLSAICGKDDLTEITYNYEYAFLFS